MTCQVSKICYNINMKKDKKLINLYNHYINEDVNLSKESGVIKPDYEMGYISTVDEARKKLEKVFKLNQET